MKDYDIVGYCNLDNHFCPSHGRHDHDAPIFAGTEFEYIPTCAECGEELDVNLVDLGCPGGSQGQWMS